MNLNIPETRQQLLEERLLQGVHIVAADIAAEFSVSVDTIRRDILALEANGKAHRVRGGAVPVSKPISKLLSRISGEETIKETLVVAARDYLFDSTTILLDGGSTTLAIARHLTPRAGLLVVTPSPWIAIACQENDVEVFMLGGRLSPLGGVNVGESTEERLSKMSVDVAVLGACGLDSEFGLSSDDFDESHLKVAMSQFSRRTIVVTDRSKIGRQARHRTLGIEQIDWLITDADESQTRNYSREGVGVTNV